MKKYDVAVMLSTYNGEKYLYEMLESLKNQQSVDLTVYIRDDGSTDATLDIIRGWEHAFTIKNVPFDCNLGPANSFWRLCKSVGQHEYYAFCDQDDVWDSDKLKCAVQQLEDKDGPALYFCNERTINADGIVIRKHNAHKPILTFESEIVCGFGPGCSFVFNYSLLQKMTQADYTHIVMHDTLCMLIAFIYGEVIYDAEPHFSRRVHANNVIASSGKSGYKKYMGKIKKQFSKNRIQLDNFLREIRINNNFNDSQVDVCELEALINYKYNIRNKIRILKSKKYVSRNKRGLRTFRIRVLLGCL